MANPPLQSSGPISISNIRDEFLVPVTKTDIYLTCFLRGGPLVRNVYANRLVPGSPGSGVPAPILPPIKLTDYYGATLFFFKVKIETDSETKHKYGWNNDGKIKVTIWGVSSNYSVTIRGKGVNSSYKVVGGSGPVTNQINADGGTTTFNMLNNGNYQITVRDDVYHHASPYIGESTFSAKVGYDSGGSSDTYPITETGTIGGPWPAPGSANPTPPPAPTPFPLPTPVPPNPGFETFNQEPIQTFGGDDLVEF
jgi:hypothetical protein